MPSQLPPACRSRPATTSARSGQCRPGGLAGRLASSSRLAATISGHAEPGRRRRIRVHIAASVSAVTGLSVAVPLYWGVAIGSTLSQGGIMTTFDDRERGEETRFKHEQELAFKARNRGNKLFGLWVAERLGLSGEAAESY